MVMSSMNPKYPQVPAEPPAIVRGILVSIKSGTISHRRAIRALINAKAPNLLAHVSRDASVFIDLFRARKYRFIAFYNLLKL